MRRAGLIVLAGLLMAACDNASNAPPSDPLKTQREAMEKARQTGAVVDQATADRLKRAEKETK
jgi:hypothetical protein